MPLTRQQTEEYANKWLVAISDIIESKKGEEYATFAGEAFMEACSRYDPSRGEIRQYLFSKTPLIAVDLYRAFYGREGSGRRSEVRIHEDFDVADTRERPIKSDKKQGLNNVLLSINKARRLQRWVVLARVLGEFSNSDLTRMLNVSERQICREAANVRELLHAH